MWKIEKQLYGHLGAIYALNKSNIPKHILTGGADKMLVQWDLENLTAGVVLAKTNGVIYCIKASNQTILIGTSTGELHVIDSLHKQEIKLLHYHNSGVYNIDYYEPLQLYLIAGGDGVLSICDAGWQLIKQIKLTHQKLRTIAIHPTLAIAYIGCGNGHVVKFDLQNLMITHNAAIHRTQWSCNTIAIKNNFLITGGRDAMLHIVDADSLQIQKSIAAHNYAIYDTAFNADKSLMATASRDKSIKIWDTENWQVLQKLAVEKNDGHKNSVNKIYWNADLMKLISVSDDKTVIIWQTEETE